MVLTAWILLPSVLFVSELKRGLNHATSWKMTLYTYANETQHDVRKRCIPPATDPQEPSSPKQGEMQSPREDKALYKSTFVRRYPMGWTFYVRLSMRERERERASISHM